MRNRIMAGLTATALTFAAVTPTGASAQPFTVVPVTTVPESGSSLTEPTAQWQARYDKALKQFKDVEQKLQAAKQAEKEQQEAQDAYFEAQHKARSFEYELRTARQETQWAQYKAKQAEEDVSAWEDEVQRLTEYANQLDSTGPASAVMENQVAIGDAKKGLAAAKRNHKDALKAVKAAEAEQARAQKEYDPVKAVEDQKLEALTELQAKYPDPDTAKSTYAKQWSEAGAKVEALVKERQAEETEAQTKAGIAAGVVLVLLIAVVGAAALVPQWGVTLPIALPSIK